MPHYLYKLKFLTPLHIGADIPGVALEKVSPACHSDTFFSALCYEFLHLYGHQGISRFFGTARSPEFSMSDLLPFINDELFLPKPALYFRKNRSDINKSKDCEEKDDRLSGKKKLNKIEYIPISQWELYLDYIQGKKNLDTNEIEHSFIKDFAKEKTIQKVSLSRGRGDNQLYAVGIYLYADYSAPSKPCGKRHDWRENTTEQGGEARRTGLYFVVKMEESFKEEFDRALYSLQYSGIGGKRSSGMGKFELYEDPIELDPEEYATESDRELLKMLQCENSDYYMTISVVSPKRDEVCEELLKDAYYTLIPRRGFVASPQYHPSPIKRKPLVMFNTGSCFKNNKIQGQIMDLQRDGGHAVYRYGKAMYLGVKL